MFRDIRRQVFTGDDRRLDDSTSYVRNAVDKPARSDLEKGDAVLEETKSFSKLLGSHAPSTVCAFRAFAFEFANGSLEREPRSHIDCWTTTRLGMQFTQSVKEISPR